MIYNKIPITINIFFPLALYLLIQDINPIIIYLALIPLFFIKNQSFKNILIIFLSLYTFCFNNENNSLTHFGYIAIYTIVLILNRKYFLNNPNLIRTFYYIVFCQTLFLIDLKYDVYFYYSLIFLITNIIFLIYIYRLQKSINKNLVLS